MTRKKYFTKLSCALLLSFCVTLHSIPVLAQDSGTTRSDVFTEQDIFYYDPSGGGACAPGSPGSSPISDDVGSSTGSNQDYDGNPVWTDDELALIEEHKPTYVEAADENDVPWAMLAVIHKRESNLSLNYNSNRQGIYQFYEMAGQFPGSGTASQADFLRETKMLAEQLQNDYVTRNHSDNAGPLSANGTADNVIQDTFFSYNGRAGVYEAQARALGFTGAGEGFQGSPYVMNRADAERDPNVNRSTWGQVKRDNGPIEYPANQDYGAWPYYAAIAGAGGCGSFGDTFTMEIDGYVYGWPVAPAQQSAHRDVPGMTGLPCASNGCHHDGTPAFDISRQPGGKEAEGTPIYAIQNGEITNINPSLHGVPGCQSMQFISEDNYYYWYGHIQEIQEDLGDVQAGTQVAVMGEINCTKNGAGTSNTVEHLHIDRGARGTPGGSVGNRDSGFVPIINTLFENLPE